MHGSVRMGLTDEALVEHMTINEKPDFGCLK
jgi:hypothetical protein